MSCGQTELLLGAETIQLRLVALPPVAGDQVQLGSTSTFSALVQAIELYGTMPRQGGGPGLRASRA
jgi:hypothetical protein